MKIFVHVHGSYIDDIFIDKITFPENQPYALDITSILSYGSISQLGIDKESVGSKFFICFSNSRYLQKKWADENNFQFKDDWYRSIMIEQIKQFEPDIIFTLSPNWLLKNFDITSDIPLKSFWKASPVLESSDYSEFDLGLTYHDVYAEYLRAAGVDNIELHNFGFDSNTYELLNNINKRDIDLSFIGTYNNQFTKRNQYLKQISKKYFLKNKNIRYHLRIKAGRRFKGLLPNVNPYVYYRYKKPVYLRQMLLKLKRSKIAFNCHSDIAGKGKGNMRIYEALAMKSLLLSDYGDYPPHFVDGKNYVSYKNVDDLFYKINYYWNNPTERENIAEAGYKMLRKYYDIESRSKNLLNIFNKYLH